MNFGGPWSAEFRILRQRYSIRYLPVRYKTCNNLDHYPESNESVKKGKYGTSMHLSLPTRRDQVIGPFLYRIHEELHKSVKPLKSLRPYVPTYVGCFAKTKALKRSPAPSIWRITHTYVSSFYFLFFYFQLDAFLLEKKDEVTST